MESHGEKIKIQKNWKLLVILHVKDSEASMMTISEFDPNLWIFDIFSRFLPTKQLDSRFTLFLSYTVDSN